MAVDQKRFMWLSIKVKVHMAAICQKEVHTTLDKSMIIGRLKVCKSFFIRWRVVVFVRMM